MARAAELSDLLASLSDMLPWMGLFVVGVTLVLLFLAFGSVVLPVKAVLMNVLSLSASFGALVWIFQDGHLTGLLGFTSTGFIEATQPILMLAMAFGLSMDYEVFLLSRIREQWDAHRRQHRSPSRPGCSAPAGSSPVQRCCCRGDRRVLDLGHRVHQDDRRRHDHRDPDRRDDRARVAGAREHAAARPVELVGAGPLARFWDRHGFREYDGDARCRRSGSRAPEPVPAATR